MSLPADSAFASALAAYRSRDFEKAAEQYRAMVDRDPYNAAAWKGLAHARARRQEWEGALTAAKVVIELRADDVRAWRRLGRLCLSADRQDLALPVWEHVTHLAPHDATSHYVLGSLLFRADREREAGEALGKAVGLRPDFARAHYLLGLVHLALDDASSAHHRHRILRSLDPQLAAGLQRAIAPHRQQTVMFATIIVLSLWLSAGKWFVPHRYSEAWQLGGMALFLAAFVAYRTYQRQAHPEGLPVRRWGDGDGDREVRS